MTIYTREQWGARPPAKAPTPLDTAEVVGIVLHWPGTPAAITTVEAVKRALRGWQNMHIEQRGWNDIAYQEAIDQQGNVYRLRGLGNRSGANGDGDLNARFGALLLIVAEGEKPSAAMIAAVRERIAKQRTLFPNSRHIKGHGQVREGGTQCPGKAVQALIDADEFEPAAKTPNITAFRLAKTRAEKRAAAEKIAAHGSQKARAAALDWLDADTGRAFAAKTILNEEVQ